jgi:hypothetical protein
MIKLILAAILIFLMPGSALAQQTFNPHTGQWENSNKPDVNIGPGGAVDSRTGTHFGPTGDGGVVNTRDGTVWTRSGDTLTNTRTGEVVFSPEQKGNRGGSGRTPSHQGGTNSNVRMPTQQVTKEQACINSKKIEEETRERLKSTRCNRTRRDLRNQLREHRANITKYCY